MIVLRNTSANLKKWLRPLYRIPKPELLSPRMKIEHADTGRVLLKDFYGSALDGNWQLRGEKPDFGIYMVLGCLHPSSRAVVMGATVWN